MWKPDLCIYHGGCDDGFAAAWCIWQKWPDVEFVPGVYGKPPPDVTGLNVLMVDFSYKYDVIVEMSFKAKRIVILDHHKTAQADLLRLPQMRNTPEAMEEMARECWGQNMPEVMTHFDMEKSGARLAYEFCNPPDASGAAPQVPLLIALVEDRDLWRFAYGDDTRQFSAALRTYNMNFTQWSEIARNPEPLIEEGKTILKAHQFNIQKFMNDAFQERVGGRQVPCVNVPYHYASDAAHALLELFPDAPFAAAWFKRGDGLVQFSLRSDDSREDVSAIAKGYGGGGHRNAAGFQLDSLAEL